MTRLIDADELLKELEEWEADLYDTNPKRQLGVTDAIVIACQMPTVDAIPVEWMRKWIDAPVSEESMDRCDTSKGDLIEWMILEWAERKEI